MDVLAKREARSQSHDIIVKSIPLKSHHEDPSQTLTLVIHRIITSSKKRIHKHGRSLSARVGLIHERNLPRNSRPLELAFQGLIPLLLLELFPFQKLVGEAQVWLDDDVQSSCADETAIIVRISAGSDLRWGV